MREHRLHIVRFAAAVVIALGSFAHAPAHAAQPPRVDGQDCGFLAAQLGKANVWQTTFRGYRLDVFGDPEHIFTAPCFPSEADCKAWLYWAQSDWQHNFYQWPPCQKGLR